MLFLHIASSSVESLFSRMKFTFQVFFTLASAKNRRKHGKAGLCFAFAAIMKLLFFCFLVLSDLEKLVQEACSTYHLMTVEKTVPRVPD